MNKNITTSNYYIVKSVTDTVIDICKKQPQFTVTIAITPMVGFFLDKLFNNIMDKGYDFDVSINENGFHAELKKNE